MNKSSELLGRLLTHRPSVHWLWVLVIPLILGVAPAVAEATPDTVEESPGKTAFIQLKCNVCHAVSVEAIPRKSKSEKLKGRDLSEAGTDFDRDFARGYILKEESIEGVSHKKPFRGTDEELDAILDWLATLKASS